MRRPDKTAYFWRDRDWAVLWTGNALSELGSSVSAIAYPLLVLAATGSAARAGLVSAAGLAGTVATTLFGGVLADRVSRRTLIAGASLAQAVALGTVGATVAAGRFDIRIVVIAELVSGASFGLRSSAGTAALRRIVPREHLSAASAQSMGRDMAARLVGAPVGGALFAISHALPFLVDSVSFLFAAAGVVLVRRALGPDARDARRGHLADLRSGFAFVRRVPFLRFIVGWNAAINVAYQGFLLLAIVAIRDRGGSSVVVGEVTSLALAGGIIGAACAPALLRVLPAKLLLAFAAWAFVSAAVLVGVLPRVWETGAVLFTAMITVAPLNVVLQTYRLRLVPDSMSGRVSSAVGFSSGSLQWIGPTVFGLLAGGIGIRMALIDLAVALIPACVALHMTGSLDVLRTPVDRVEELSSTGAVAADGGRLAGAAAPR